MSTHAPILPADLSFDLPTLDTGTSNSDIAPAPGVDRETVTTRSTAHRRVRPEETQVVMATASFLHDGDAASPALLPKDVRGVATVDDTRQTVLIPGVRATPPPPLPRNRKRGKVGLTASLLMVLVSVAVTFGGLQAVHPIFGRSPAAQPLVLSAASFAVNPNNPIPTGPFQTGAGASTTLGIGGGAGPGVNAPGSAGLPAQGVTNDVAAPGSVAVTGISAAPLSSWPPANAYMFVPGHPAFGVPYPADGFYGWAFGQCTWWAQNERRDENLTHMGNAQYWAGSAAGRGYTVSGVPRANATVVLQPGVQGAGGAGHVAHVVAVYPGGWFLVSEMNFYWNGGGWGRVDYRYAHAGWGVSFIY